MTKAHLLLDRWLGPRSLVVSLFVLTLAFQAAVITKLAVLYTVLKVLFVGFVLLLLASFFKAAAKDKVLVLIILAVILIRLPFFFHATGLITMSDNALEAIQSLEIQDSHIVPFYQFEILTHQGTLRYLLVAFIWDFIGTHYLALVLLNVLVFTGIVLLLGRLLAPVVSRTAVVVVSLLSLSFIETMFDFSLLIRGGIYLDALFLVLLGMSIFDFEFKRAGDMILAYYFLFLAFYIQPVALLFAGSFAVCTFAAALKARKFWRNAGLFLGGAFLGTFHLFYYELLFPAKPVSPSPLEQIRLIPLASISWRLFVKFFWTAREAFLNLIRYEFSYFMGSAKLGPPGKALAVLNTACLYASLVVVLAGLGIALSKLVRTLRTKARFNPQTWPYLFFVVLLLGFAVKTVALLPVRVEPRHNIDLLVLIILAYVLVLDVLFRGKKLLALRVAATAAVLLAFTLPHYYAFLKNTIAKDASYHELMAALSKYKVKSLATDFNLAYPVYFLSQRKIMYSDSIGPLAIGIFHPEIQSRVDALPDTDKSFLFYSPAAGTREWHKRATRELLNETLDRLRKENIGFKMITLKDYILVVPNKVRFENPPKGDEP